MGVTGWWCLTDWAEESKNAGAQNIFLLVCEPDAIVHLDQGLRSAVIPLQRIAGSLASAVIQDPPDLDEPFDGYPDASAGKNGPFSSLALRCDLSGKLAREAVSLGWLIAAPSGNPF